MGQSVMDIENIKLWHREISATEADYNRYWGMLDQAEQNHASAIKNERFQHRFVEIRAKLRMVLGEAVNSAPGKLRIDKAKYGKPYLVDYPALDFNLSHTANRMVVAIGHHCDLGVDIEQCKPRKTLEALVDKCFAEEEKAYWQQLRQSQQVKVFYQFWTRKEAFVKATGRGIALGMNLCVINPEKPSALLRIPGNYGNAGDWLIQEIEMGDAICGAMAFRKRGSN